MSGENKKALFLRIEPDLKQWFEELVDKLQHGELGKVTQNTVGERILGNLKKNPRLLKEALK